MKLPPIYPYLILTFSILFFSCNEKSSKTITVSEDYETPISIPIGENSWAVSKNLGADQPMRGSIITEKGIRNWRDAGQEIKTYFRVQESGEIHLGLKARKVEENAEIEVSFNGQTVEITLQNDTWKALPIGTFEVENKGYQELTISLKNSLKKGSVEIEALEVGGKATEKEVYFVKDNFHFGRRGPSVHLRFPIPEESEKPLYFYNEIEVPEGQDILGSYFMANGFSHGYFGIQVNSEKERRVLFSVWSPYDTQDPREIPEDQRIELIKKGDQTHVGEFGNEGSGGQSYKRHFWKAGVTYGFLLKGEPYGKTHTDYTAYFFDPEQGEWELIARFRRPKSNNYLGNLYSFLENFIPATGNISRQAIYKNQWLYDKDSGWVALEKAQFTADATANKNDRLDYAGGEAEGGYFLKNCGFFNDYTKMNTAFSRNTSTGAQPEIDFKALP